SGREAPTLILDQALKPDPGSASSDSWSGWVPWGIREPKEMPSIFEREWMLQGACSGREARTLILDQALSSRRMSRLVLVTLLVLTSSASAQPTWRELSRARNEPPQLEGAAAHFDLAPPAEGTSLEGTLV